MTKYLFQIFFIINTLFFCTTSLAHHFDFEIKNRISPSMQDHQKEITLKIESPHSKRRYFKSSTCLQTDKDPICLQAGYVSTKSGVFPLVARTDDGGATYTYPKSIKNNLTRRIDPKFKKGSLESISCTGSIHHNLCITAGGYDVTDRRTEDFPATDFPLLAISTNTGKKWHYPGEIFRNLRDKLDPNFTFAYFTNASCAGAGDKAICIASGIFGNENSRPYSSVFPLLALSRDGGNTWRYPEEIFKNLPITLDDPTFLGAEFVTSNCSGTLNKALCIAAGFYFPEYGAMFPILSFSHDGGLSWQYPKAIYTDLQKAIDPTFWGGQFISATCMGAQETGICLAVGQWCNYGDQICFPLIARSADGGQTWTYPATAFSGFPDRIDEYLRYSSLDSVSCKGSASSNVCTASGIYVVDEDETHPLVAVSYDSGATWKYAQEKQ